MNSSHTAKQLMGEAHETYSTTVKVDMSGVDPKLAMTSGTAAVTWDLTYEGRSWGVKDLDVVLASIKAHAQLTHAETGQDSAFVAEWSVAQPNGWTVQVKVMDKFSFPAVIYPQEVLVSVLQRQMTVKF